MADERLVQGLAAWLRDSDTPAPDSLMSASRVMAGVEVTPRLGRLWPPARFAPKVEPAPALGAFGPDGPPPRPMPRVQKPKIKERTREVLTSVRFLAVSSVAALALSVMLLAASMLPSEPTGEPTAALLLAASAEPSLAPPAATPPPTAEPEPSPSPLPTWADTDRALDWHTDSVRLEATGLTLAVGGQSFDAPSEVTTTGLLTPRRTSLEGGWTEDLVEQRLVVEIARDETDWWVERIRTYDGRRKAGWIDFAGLAVRTRTPLGEAWTGDLRASSSGAERKAYRKKGAATLAIDELRLSAFGPEGSLAGTP